jgi:enolase
MAAIRDGLIDLVVLAASRIATGIEKKACNALLLKVNQIGTVTESIKAATMSMQNGWGVMCSHRYVHATSVSLVCRHESSPHTPW